MKAALLTLLIGSVQNFSLAPALVPERQMEPGGMEVIAPRKEPGSVFVLYSWSMGNTERSADHSLANLPSNVETILLSFARPSGSYILGQMTWRGTGLNFSASFDVVRNAVTILKMKNPSARILLSVGGPTYLNWKEAHPRSIASLVADLGLDGVDLNYQPIGAGLSDEMLIQLVRSFRENLPRPLILSVTVWPYMELWAGPLMAVGGHFDQLHIPTAEGADTTPVLLSYQEIYKGPLFWSRYYSW